MLPTFPPLRVAEVFYSLQGEGARAGEPSVFVRLAGCSAKHACFAAGVVCDTEFEAGEAWDDTRLRLWLAEHAPDCRWIVWTGGEPLDQLTPAHLAPFSDYRHALETSGVRPLAPELADLFAHVTVSPKVAEHVLLRHFPSGHVDELRYVRHAGQPLPEPALAADHRFLSPHADGDAVSREALAWCITLCLRHPAWRLSVQLHKLWRVR